MQRIARGIDKYSSPSIGTAIVTNSPQGTRVEAPNSTLTGLAILLEPRTPLRVVDITGLTGRYQIMIEMSLDRNTLLNPFTGGSPRNRRQPVGYDHPAANAGGCRCTGRNSAADMSAAELKAWQTALLKVGLRLEQRKAVAETLVVDHMERMPTEN